PKMVRCLMASQGYLPLPGLGFSKLHYTNYILFAYLFCSDTRPNSILFSFGIAKQCTKRWEILKFLMSKSSEIESRGLDPSILSDLMGLQAANIDMPQQLFAPEYGFDFHDESQQTIFYPSSEFYSWKPLFDMARDIPRMPEINGHLDGQSSSIGAGTEMKDILSIIAEFYLSKNSTKWKMQSVLVPHFDRLDSTKAMANIQGSSKLNTVNFVPLKSPEKAKNKPSLKKKNNRKACKERDLYRKNYFQTCESLLSIMVDKNRNGKTAILALKKSGPELPQLLTQCSASIAGTGLALLFSVVLKVGSGRVPFCASKLLNTGLAFGLVWLSWAVNRLRDTIAYISKNSGKSLKDEEMMKNVDRSLKEIYFRAGTLMAVVVLRLA
ncbi:hypothetical protein RJ639_000376, partial [Escallonia herrerae]